MKKQYLFGFKVIMLVFTLAFAGCDFFGGDSNPGPGTGGSDNPNVTHYPIIIDMKDVSNNDIKITLTTTRAANPWTPDTGDGYEISKNGSQVSKGTIDVNNGAFVTFKSSTNGRRFEAIMTSSSSKPSLNFPEGITTDSSESITFPNSGVTNPTFNSGGDLDTTAIMLSQNASSSRVLEVITSSPGSDKYQWYSYGTSGTGGTPAYSGSAIAATTAKYTLPTNVEGTFYYYVYITNASGGFAKSKIATVVVTAGTTPGGEIGDILSDNSGNFYPSGNTTIIVGPVQSKANSVISSGKTVRVVGTNGTAGSLTIPGEVTVTIKNNGRLEIDGELRVLGTLFVESGGYFNIRADSALSSSGGTNGTLNGSGIISNGGEMRLPKLADISSFSGTIEVRTSGELFLGTYNSTGMYYPLIGNKGSLEKISAGTSFTSGSAVSEYVVTDGKIQFMPVSGNIGTMYLTGEASVMGRPSNSTNIATVSNNFTIYPKSKLTIGIDNKPTYLTISDVSIEIADTGSVVLNTGSVIKGTASTMSGTGRQRIFKADGQTKAETTTSTNMYWMTTVGTPPVF
jgi:hypothetical protein